MPDSRVQLVFMEQLLRRGVTRQDVADFMGLDRSLVSRWASGDRMLSLLDALHLVERFGGQPLVAAGRTLGLELAVGPDDPVGAVDDGPLAEVAGRLLCALLEAARVLATPGATSPARRGELVQRLASLEALLRAVQHRLAAAA
jgi:transcriptional regulator with XRE-family HTH domain